MTFEEETERGCDNSNSTSASYQYTDSVRDNLEANVGIMDSARIQSDGNSVSSHHNYRSYRKELSGSMYNKLNHHHVEQQHPQPQEEIKASKKPLYTRSQWITLFTLGLINFCEGVIISLQAPFYPAEAEKKGATATEYGLVFGVFELVVFLVSPIFGKYMTKIGTKFILNAGIFITSTCCILFGLLDKVPGRDAFVGLSFAVRIIQAVGEAGYMTASFTIIASAFPDNVATTFAALETCFGLGIIAGPTVGGALYQLGGYTLPFVTLGSLLFVAACVTFLILPSPPDDENSECKFNVFDMLKIPPVFLATLTTFCGASAIGFVTALLEPHLRQFNLSPVVNGLMFIIGGGVYALMAPVWGWLCDSVGQTKLFCIAGALSSCVAFTLLGPAPFLPFETTLWVCMVALVFHGIGSGGEIVCAFLGSLKEAVKHGYPDNLGTYGLVSALWSSSFALGAFVGPSVAGVLFDHFGFRIGSLFILIEQALLASIIIFYLTYRKCTKSKYSNLEASFQNETKPLLGTKSKEGGGPSNC